MIGKYAFKKLRGRFQSAQGTLAKSVLSAEQE
jgi:hypothetical protein